MMLTMTFQGRFLILKQKQESRTKTSNLTVTAFQSYFLSVIHAAARDGGFGPVDRGGKLRDGRRAVPGHFLVGLNVFEVEASLAALY